MDFFEQQARAQRKSLQLYGLMALAVVCLISLACVMLAALVCFGERNLSDALQFWNVLQPRQLTALVLSMLFIISAASVLEYLNLRAGGSVVAQALGGTLIARSTTNLNEKRIINVVEEMAIASGVPVPPVYLLDEPGINAFAAGHSIDDAAIGITRGALERLTRDELQGVIAHEFSHIFHGDMRINMRLSALLYGILFIALMGEFLMRSSSRARVSSEKNNLIPTVGLALFVLGYCGVFFANLIKASVSRQREFLADASAVQYTRNPNGIAGALHKISNASSQIIHPKAAQFSHLYFSMGLPRLNTFFATHPPLRERIHRINPRFKASTRGLDLSTPSQTDTAHASHPAASAFSPAGIAARSTSMEASPLASPLESAITSVAQPTPEHLHYAHALIARIPDNVNRALNDAYAARGLVLGLFLDTDPAKEDEQWHSLPAHAFLNERDALREDARAAKALGVDFRLAIVELALPSLKQLPPGLIRELLAAIDILIEADANLCVDDWTLSSILKLQLQPAESAAISLPPHDLHAAIVIAALAQRGADDVSAQSAAYIAAISDLNIRQPKASSLGFTQIDTALHALNQLPILKKLALLKRAVVAITHDRHISYREAELLRLVALRLNCPMPPLLIGINSAH